MTSPIPCSHESSIAIANYLFIWMVQPPANLSFPNWRDRHRSDVADGHAAAKVSCPPSFVLPLHVHFSPRSLKAANLALLLLLQTCNCYLERSPIPQLIYYTKRKYLSPIPTRQFCGDDIRASDIQFYLLDRVIYNLISLRVVGAVRVTNKLWISSRHKIWLAARSRFLCYVGPDVFSLHNPCQRLAVFPFLVHSNFLILPCHTPS